MYNPPSFPPPMMQHNPPYPPNPGMPQSANFLPPHPQHSQHSQQPIMLNAAPRGGSKAQYKNSASAGKAAIADLPPHLEMMFAPKEPIQFVKHIPSKKQSFSNITGLNNFLSHFDTKNIPKIYDDDFQMLKTVNEIRKRKISERNALHQIKLKELLEEYKPNEKFTTDAFNTLFVGRLSYETTEKKLRREFETYGNIESVVLVHDKEGKSRGYAFITFQSENELKVAFRSMDGKKIDGKRIIVDVERGRYAYNH